ncbi:MAG TPA: AraC family transcriptional regulator [Steroidobacteraceae bacterium]|nr:AraC family transcriptional regulator [Steroidobacteraceae bacterium]
MSVHQLLIDAELQVPAATAQLVHLPPIGPSVHIMQQRSDYWLDLCLTPRPRNARACYHTHWDPMRSEPLGNLFVVPPGESIRVTNEGGAQQVSILCLLRAEVLREWFEGEPHWSDGQLKASLDIRDDNIRQLLLRLARELREPGFASATMSELIAAQLAIELYRYCRASDDVASSGGLAPWRLRRIDERLKGLAKPPTLAELAALCGISVRQLTRAFRVSRGCSIRSYVTDSQLEHAKHLLADGSSIKSVALSLGFSSPSSFCCAFRRALMETPGQFRQRLLRRDVN